jgi:predicted secreted protein
MTAIAGYGGAAVIGASGDLSELVSWQMQQKGDNVDATAMVKGATTPQPKVKLATLTEWSGQVTVNYDPSDADGQELLVANAQVAFKLYPQGDGAGFKYWSGTIIVTNVTDGGTIDGKLTKSVSFDGTGVLTRTNN